MPITTPSAALVPAVPVFTNTGRLALAGLLAGTEAWPFTAAFHRSWSESRASGRAG